MKTKPNYQKATFLLSVADCKQLPTDQGIEVAFMGRSNAGKSSVLNRLTQNKQLARVSKTPGRTQLINLFGLDEERRLVDLPGYGYAKVPLNVKEHWGELLDNYLQIRTALRGVILVMDCRHPFKKIDQAILEWGSDCKLPLHILLNKTDKLNTSDLNRLLHSMRKNLDGYQNPVTFQFFSALKNTGINELKQKLDEWFCQEI